jgi:O-acetyl-ADP-ribose deacetylase (regulator of RNase III)
MGAPTQKMQIRITRADLTSVKVDAIVNPTAAPVDRLTGRVHVPATDPPTSIPVGNAIVTSGGNVLCRFVIHAAVPPRDHPEADAKLRQATWSCLQRAEELAIASIAIPAMSVGPLGFTMEDSARILIRAALDFRTHARSLQRVLFFVMGEEPEAIFTALLEEMQ